MKPDAEAGLIDIFLFFKEETLRASSLFESFLDPPVICSPRPLLIIPTYLYQLEFYILSIQFC